jgi:hypothetical protein
MRPRVIAVIEPVLIFPAVLFMTSLVLRNLQPLQYEPARSAQQLVMWYADRMWTLWVFLLALPITVLVSGMATLRYKNRDLLHTSRALLGAITLVAGGILTIVVLHMLAN